MIYLLLNLLKVQVFKLSKVCFKNISKRKPLQICINSKYKLQPFCLNVRTPKEQSSLKTVKCLHIYICLQLMVTNVCALKLIVLIPSIKYGCTKGTCVNFYTWKFSLLQISLGNTYCKFWGGRSHSQLNLYLFKIQSLKIFKRTYFINYILQKAGYCRWQILAAFKN